MPRSADLIMPPRPFRLVAGAGLALAIGALVAIVLWAILAAAANEPAAASTPVDIAHLLRMTTIQASLSTALSLAVGLALAWALNRLRFRGRAIVVALFASAIVTPGIVVAFGLLSIWGRNGWINSASQALFGHSFASPAFGLSGILMAHVILNGAFAARILLAALDAIPATRLKTGQSLGLSAWQRWSIIDWPALRATLPGLGSIIFLLTFTSFPIVLLLGGGPANQTLEVAIYSAVRQDFDLRGAVMLALTQIGFCSAIILVSASFSPVQSSPGPSRAQNWRDGMPAQIIQWTILAAGLLAFALPLLSVLVDGMSVGLVSVIASPSFWAATATSLAIASLSALLALALALLLAMARAATTRPLLKLALALPAFAYLAVPAVVLSLGFFLAVRMAGISPAKAAHAIVIIANALLALPFVIATLGPPLQAIAHNKGRLIRSLGMGGVRQFRDVEFPLLSREIGIALALAFCFSLGDLGVIALFGTQDFTTLPLLLMRALGAYRTNDAAAISALMLILTITVFATFPKMFETIANARR